MIIAAEYEKIIKRFEENFIRVAKIVSLFSRRA